MRSPHPALAACLGAAIAVPTLIAGDASQTITEAEVRAHLDFLASDLLEGRDSGFRGGEVAAAYIESQLAARGFRPLFDGYQMPFDLRGAAGRAKVRMRAGATEHSNPELLEVLGASALGDFHAPLVTMSTDPSGKIVLATGGDDTEKADELAKEYFDKGAKGVIFVTAQEKFEIRARRDGRRRATPKPKVEAPPEAAPTGGGYLTATDAFLATHSMESADALVFSGPVLRVARDVGPELMDLIDHEGEIDLSIRRDGIDRSTNVIAWLEGSDETMRDEYVVIGAHYDHVGFDDQGNIWNGADDNGSGTVSVLEIADALSRMPTHPKRSVVVCLWGAEERGLVGSTAFVRQKRLDPEKIAAYINLDMVGRNDANSIFGLNASTDMFELAGRCGTPHGMEVTKGAEMFLSASDSGPFIQEKVPTLFFFSGLHDQYHTPADDPGTVDYLKITKVARTAFDTLVTLADASSRPRFEESRPVAGSGESKRRLGIFPDEDAKTVGVTIRAVTSKSVASLAGIRAKDRIVRIGELPVKDMASMREAIAAQADGKGFPIEVVRDETSVVLEAKFEAAPEPAKEAAGAKN